MRADHCFHLAVGWASAALLVLEVAMLWRRHRRSRDAAPREDEEPLP
jgi:hypothetical protein